MDESAEFDYADDFDDDAHDGTDRGLDPSRNTPAPPESVRFLRNFLLMGNLVGFLALICSGYGGEEEGFHEA